MERDGPLDPRPLLIEGRLMDRLGAETEGRDGALGRLMCGVGAGFDCRGAGGATRVGADGLLICGELVRDGKFLDTVGALLRGVEIRGDGVVTCGARLRADGGVEIRGAGARVDGVDAIRGDSVREGGVAIRGDGLVRSVLDGDREIPALDDGASVRRGDGVAIRGLVRSEPVRSDT